MSKTAWIESHYRNGCWVKAHRRGDGTFVKGHRRKGGNVTSHYMASSEHRTRKDDTKAEPRPPRRIMPALWVEPTANMATVALVLGTYRIARVRPRANGRAQRATAQLRTVIYRDQAGQRHRVSGLPVAFSTVDLPSVVEAVTLEIDVTTPDGRRRYRLDAPVFCNADGSVSATRDGQLDPKVVNNVLDRIMGNATEMETAQRRNRIRQRLGASDPERAVSQAMHDIMQLNPPPNLDLRRELTIPVPGASYTIIVRPKAKAA